MASSWTPADSPIPDAVVHLLNWEQVLTRCESDTHLTPASRELQRRGIGLLRGIFGDEFPRQLWMRRHPLIDAFVLGGHYYRRFLAGRGFALASLKKIQGFDRLLVQFISSDRDKYSEAVAVADLASRLQDVGIEVAFERPTTYAANAHRPDLCLSIPNDELAHLEVSQLGDSEAWEQSDLTASEITKALFFGTGPSQGSVRLERPLSPKHASHLVGEIKKLREEAIATGGFRCLDRPGTIRIGIAGPDGLAALAEWARERELEVNTGTGAEVKEDFGRRLAAKVLREQEQLPADGLGIIFIPITKLTFSAEELLQQLAIVEEEVYKHHHVTLVVFQWTVHGLESVLSHADMPPSESSELLVEDSPRHQVLVWNKFAGQRLSANAQDLVKRALSLKPQLERIDG